MKEEESGGRKYKTREEEENGDKSYETKKKRTTKEGR